MDPAQALDLAPKGEDRFDYFTAKYRKQIEQFEQQQAGRPPESALFAGLVFWFNGATSPPNDVLRAALSANGGAVRHVESAEVTHVIASQMASWRSAHYAAMRRPPKVVLPAWVIESIAAGRRLAEVDFGLDPAAAAGRIDFAPQASGGRHAGNDFDFVRTYFAESRLHHIGSWRNDWVALLIEKQRSAAGAGGGGAGASEDGGEDIVWPRVIAHVDIDCFFAQIALLERPDLKNAPCAVAHGAEKSSAVDEGRTGSAEISSANYVARAFGVRAGMFVSAARALCPNLHVLPYDFERSRGVTQTLYRALLALSPRVQALSCDEAYADLSGCARPLAQLRAFRAKFFRDTGCSVSVGVGSTLLCARIATSRAKPDGIFVAPGDTAAAAAFILPLDASTLPGVGGRTKAALNAAGVSTVADIVAASTVTLERALGSAAAASTLSAFARGIDTRAVVTLPPPRKSIGIEMNYGIRLLTRDDTDRVLFDLATELSSRLTSSGAEEAALGGEPGDSSADRRLRAQCLTLKVLTATPGSGPPRKFNGHGCCDAHSRSRRIAETSDPTALCSVARSLLADLLSDLRVSIDKLRGFGLTATELTSAYRRREFAARLGLEVLAKSSSTAKCGVAPNAAATEGVIEVMGDDEERPAPAPLVKRQCLPSQIAARRVSPTRLKPALAEWLRSANAHRCARSASEGVHGEDDVVIVDDEEPSMVRTHGIWRAHDVGGYLRRALSVDVDGTGLARDVAAVLAATGDAESAVVLLRAFARLASTDGTLQRAFERVKGAITAQLAETLHYRLVY